MNSPDTQPNPESPIIQEANRIIGARRFFKTNFTPELKVYLASLAVGGAFGYTTMWALKPLLLGPEFFTKFIQTDPLLLIGTATGLSLVNNYFINHKQLCSK